MTRREKQIAAMLDKGLTIAKIAHKTGLTAKYVKNVVTQIRKVSRGEEVPAVVERSAPAPKRCTYKNGCDCVLCAARRYKYRRSGGRIDEFYDHYSTHGNASHDGRVVRQSIGKA